MFLLTFVLGALTHSKDSSFIILYTFLFYTSTSDSTSSKHITKTNETEHGVKQMWERHKKACLSSKCDVKVACTATLYNMPKGTVDNGSVYMYRYYCSHTVISKQNAFIFFFEDRN